MTSTTFGIEEEFVLVEPGTLAVVDIGLDAVADLAARGLPGEVVREFHPSQIEYASSVFSDVDEALTEVSTFRRALAQWACEHGAIAAGAGTPLLAHSEAAPVWKGRYGRIARDVGAIAREHHINGLHVHVGVSDAAAGAQASNALRAWLPVLLALSSNSPFWNGRDTGFASWRALHSRRWTTYGIPPRFADERDYHDSVRALSGIGATSDPGTINWNVRLSATHPTVEIRVFDAQLDARSSVALAVITKALVTAGAGTADAADGIWDAALWHASRDGVTDQLVSPLTARLASAPIVLEQLHDIVRAHAGSAAERALVDVFLSDIARSGSGAQRQRAAGSVPALADLYRRSMIAPVPEMAL